VNPGVLYISYDGMLEPLGQSQVLAYLERLSPGRRIHLISFEKRDDWRDRARREAVRRRIEQAGIRWHPLRYHRRPSAPATAFDLFAGSALAVGLARRYRLGIVHARSDVAGVMALAVKRATGASFLFDMRGFWADERVDGKLWPAGGRLYRAAKSVERRLLLAADHVVTLTHASEKELRRWDFLQARMPPITVIPTCADLDRFTIQGPPQRDPFVLGYVGSVGTWYLLEEMLRCFVVLREIVPSSRLLIINRNEHGLIRARATAHGIVDGDLELAVADHADVPKFLVRMTAGLAFYNSSYSRLACAPTKLGEYLACGVPCLGSAGVGDIEQILDDGAVGLTVAAYSEDKLRGAVCRLVDLVSDPDIQLRCRKVAKQHFSLESGCLAYASIYDSLALTGEQRDPG